MRAQYQRLYRRRAVMRPMVPIKKSTSVDGSGAAPTGALAEYRVEGKRLIVEVFGTFGPDEAVQRFERITIICRPLRLTQVLIDCRELGGQWSATPEIIYASRIADIYRSYLEDGGSPFLLAHVASDAFMSGWSPGVEMAEEGRMDLYTTTDFDAALAWLDRA